jgi:membrane-associated phospholipid phosphatase
LAVFTFAYARRFGGLVFPRIPRLFFCIFAPIAVSQCLATIYLRHHWGLDIVLGLLLGYLSNIVAGRLRATSSRQTEDPRLHQERRSPIRLSAWARSAR